MRTLLPAFILLATSLSAQTWAPIGATWTYAAYSITATEDPPFPISITCIGDTIISGTSCQILDVPFLPCFFIGFYTGPIYTYEANDSVYWYDEAGEVFRLLIPFDAQAGESWIVPVASGVPGEILDTMVYYVDAVSQTDIDGIPLQQLHVSRSSVNGVSGLLTGGSDPIVERLGDLIYMMPWVDAGCSDGYGVEGLVCYEDDQINWLNPDYSSCDLGIGMNEQGLASTISIHPNVVQVGDVITISAGSAVSVELLDMFGRLILSDGLEHSNMLVVAYPGLFIVRITDAQGRQHAERVVIF